jgi:hypothetical protein
VNILATAYRRRELDAQAEVAITQAVREARAEQAPEHRNNAMPYTGKASGFPLQIIAGGHPIVSMQRRRWRPDQIADCEQCGATCTCVA